MLHLQNGSLFGPEELHTLCAQNLSCMQTDIRLQYQDKLRRISSRTTGTCSNNTDRGIEAAPHIVIDPEFSFDGLTAIEVSRESADFLMFNRDTVRNALLDYGIAEPHQNPFQNAHRGRRNAEWQ